MGQVGDPFDKQQLQLSVETPLQSEELDQGCRLPHVQQNFLFYY